jgi:hypothetical protein
VPRFLAQKSLQAAAIATARAYHVYCEVFTALIICTALFCFVTPSGLEGVHRSFGRTDLYIRVQDGGRISFGTLTFAYRDPDNINARMPILVPFKLPIVHHRKVLKCQLYLHADNPLRRWFP